MPIDLYELIRCGAYASTIDHPERPKRPPLLAKVAGDLTAAEIAQLPRLQEEYERAGVAYANAMRQWCEAKKESIQRFRSDLREAHKLPAGDPFVEKMLGLAWDRGHAHGFCEVVLAFQDLLPLWEIYKASLMERRG